MRAVQQHGPSQAEERCRRAGQDAAGGLQEAGGHSHSLRLLDACVPHSRTVERDSLCISAYALADEASQVTEHSICNIFVLGFFLFLSFFYFLQ